MFRNSSNNVITNCENDLNNQTTTPLGSGETYTGTWSTTSYPDVAVSCQTDNSGTLYFDFSNDGGANVNTFPTNGFTIQSGIHELHTAVKLGRSFRVRLVNDTGAQSYLRIYTFVGSIGKLNAPLNQDISPDADSIIVRGVQTGQNPQGVFINKSFDGSAFRTNSNLGGTTLQTTMTSSTPSTIALADASDFASTGYIKIGDEIIEYNNKTGNNIDIVTRGAFFTNADAHSINDILGEVYQSGVLPLDGYTQVATKFRSSNTGSLLFQWFYDDTGSILLRELTPTYSNVDTYDFLSAPNFGPYVRYIWANTQSSTTTSLYFETEFYTQAVSAQVLTLDSGLFGSMTANLGRNIIAGKTEGGSYINAGITNDGEIFTNTLASNRQTRAVYNSGTISADTYVIFVDLSTEPYNNYVSIDNINISCRFGTNNSDANIKIGVIERVDGTDADVSWLISAPFSAANANTYLNLINNFQPSSVKMEISGGSLINAYTNDKSTALAAINTGLTLPTPIGTATPAVGDCVIFFDHTGNNFSSVVSAIYHTD